MLRACDNPFAVHRVLAERYRMSDAEWSRLFERLEASGGRGAIVGAHGSGKTTLLEDLAERLERRGELDYMLVDGADELSWLAWTRLRLRARSTRWFVITSHREGLLPLLHKCETSPALLAELVHSLGESISAEESLALHRRHGGNLREALRELYDLVAR